MTMPVMRAPQTNRNLRWRSRCPAGSWIGRWPRRRLVWVGLRRATNCWSKDELLEQRRAERDSDNAGGKLQPSTLANT